jgi:hypothetical protein
MHLPQCDQVFNFAVQLVLLLLTFPFFFFHFIFVVLFFAGAFLFHIALLFFFVGLAVGFTICKLPSLSISFPLTSMLS